MAYNLGDDLKNRGMLQKLLSERILIKDGATGTALENMNPNDDNFGGEQFFGCNEMLNLHAPEIVSAIHEMYINAGADLIETNSFNGSEIVLREYGIEGKARELARLSAVIAQNAISANNPDRKVFVMGSMGPGTKTITVTGGVSFEEIYRAYFNYAWGLLEGGADLLVLETVQDTLNLKAAILGVMDAQKQLERSAPLAVSVTIEQNGSMLAGQNIEALYHTISNYDLFSVGLNCASGPADLSDHLRTLSRISRFPVSIWPNAGLPDHDGKYSDGPDEFGKTFERFGRDGFINIAGGCCGTTPGHVSAIRDAVKDYKPRTLGQKGSVSPVAGIEPLMLEDAIRPIFIGERMNSIGSRRFKRLIKEGKWDSAAEIGRKQVRKGAAILDLCTADPDREETEDFIQVLKPLLRKVKVGISLDSTDPQVIESALKCIGGKPLINSVNLEDGGARLRQVVGYARKYNASLVCGLIDDDAEQGMGISVGRKLEIADKIYKLLKTEYNIPDHDIIFDPLVFPIGTSDKSYLGSAAATIEGTRQIEEKYPDCFTLLGISNVSFGLPPVAREIINSVFLYMCGKAGLDFGIVNTQRLKRYSTIPEKERKLAEELLMNNTQEVISKYIALYKDKKLEISRDEWANLSSEQKVSQAIIEGKKEGLEENVSVLLQKYLPIEIINGPLMEGMKEVGGLFGDNKLIVAEVLESAEAMKTAVDVIKPHLKAGESVALKGKMLLATVKGDVHDIGKNLVDMIISNNGFEVINLGIKIAPDVLIKAVKKHQPDFIGLSGLLVRSAQQMIATADDLKAAGINIPLIVGGAALTRRFVLKKIAPAYSGPVFYAKDAMNGLNLANQIVDPSHRKKLISQWDEMRLKINRNTESKSTFVGKVTNTQVGWIPTQIPDPPDFEDHILDDIPLSDVLPFLNNQMLYGKRLGVKNANKKLNDPSSAELDKLKGQIEEVIQLAENDGALSLRAIYKWFEVNSEGENLLIRHPESQAPVSFKFSRQDRKPFMCAADWVCPKERGKDYLGMFVTSTDCKVNSLAKKWQSEGRYLFSHILQALALELAEATAEWVHRKMRADWGIPDPSEVSFDWLRKTMYTGIRLSFGYPACPDITMQKGLFGLLEPERIGLSLTDGYMMHPEASVSALVFHHPEGKYYSVIE